MTWEQQAALRKEALEWPEKVAPLADTAELASLRAGYYKRAGDLARGSECETKLPCVVDSLKVGAPPQPLRLQEECWVPARV